MEAETDLVLTKSEETVCVCVCVCVCVREREREREREPARRSAFHPPHFLCSPPLLSAAGGLVPELIR